MKKNRIQYLLLLLFAAGCYVFSNQYFAFVLLLFFLTLPAFSFALLALAYKGVTVDLEISSARKREESASVCFTVKNPSLFPVSGAALRIVCRNDLTGKETGAKMFCAVGGRNAGDASFAVCDVRAGRLTVFLKETKIFDLLGLFGLPKKTLLEKSVLIVPDTCDVPVGLENRTERSGDGGRCSQTKTGRDVSEIFALREYAPGDEIRAIHWKLSAKLGRHIVRDFGFSSGCSVLLLLEIFDGRAEHSDEALEACMTALVSVSRSLAEKKIGHRIAWYDAAGGQLVVREIGCAEDLGTCLPDLLSARSYRDGALALRLYEAGRCGGVPSALCYVTTRWAPGETSLRAARVLYITEERDEIPDGEAVTPVAPRNIRADLEGVTI